MTDLIKALRERREELRNELQEHPLFQEYERYVDSSNVAKPLFQYLRLFDRRLRDVNQLRSNSRSTDRPHSHELTRG